MKLSEINEARAYWGKSAAGMIAVCNNKFLLCKRSMNVTEPGTWSYPGGKIDSEEVRPLDAAIREFEEETGYNELFRTRLIHTFKDKNFKYYTFACLVNEEFTPEMNWENDDYGWFSFNDLPSPLHFGFTKTVAGKLKLYMSGGIH